MQTKLVDKINTHVSCSIKFSPRESCRLWDNVGKYGWAKQASDKCIIGHMCVACWITKATDIHWEYVILTAFPRQQWLRERASVYVIRKLPTLLHETGHISCTSIIRKVRTVCAYLSRILENVTLRMFSDFLYQLRSHRRHFVKFVLCLCLFLRVKHV